MTEYTLMPGKPFEGTEEETMETIRTILTEDAAEKQRKREKIAKAFVDRTIAVVDAPRRRATDLPELQEEPEPVAAPARGFGDRVKQALLRPVRALIAFRPTSRHVVIVALLLLVVIRPEWFVVSGAVLIAFILGLFLAFGAQRIWGGLLKAVELVEKSDGARGTRLRNSLDRFACSWDRLLDMLPDGMADDLYMPDFQKRPAEVEAQHAQAVEDRLQRLQRDG